jgi:hypothetical protein
MASGWSSERAGGQPARSVYVFDASDQRALGRV